MYFGVGGMVTLGVDVDRDDDMALYSLKSWTPEMEARLKELWMDGVTLLPLSEILTKEFGRKFTRNSIAGKARRMDLPLRQAPEMTRRIRMGRGGFYKKAEKAVKKEVAKGHPKVNLPRETLSGFKICQFIEGEPTKHDDCKCLKPVSNLTTAYCDDHLKKVAHR